MLEGPGFARTCLDRRLLRYRHIPYGMHSAGVTLVRDNDGCDFPKRNRDPDYLQGIVSDFKIRIVMPPMSIQNVGVRRSNARSVCWKR